jgi:hypothetical protein
MVAALIFQSPLYASLFAIVVYVLIRFKTNNGEAPSFLRFGLKVFGIAAALGAVGFVLMFAYCMRINSGNCPLAAIFITGPLGFTVGTILGLILWVRNVTKT